MEHNKLFEFKKLEITKQDLMKEYGKNLYSMIVDFPEEITCDDVIDLLNSFRNKEINLQRLLDWVNIVWFTELFEYKDEQSDAIASVMSELEELDEENKEITDENIALYIDALSRNKEIT